MTRKRKNVEPTNTQGANAVNNAEQGLKNECQSFNNCEERTVEWESQRKMYKGGQTRKTYGNDDFSRVSICLEIGSY
uniref:Uncharacterized protein n=1 Tax=Heterorhabditis bacteriophora TaxID=37862 RepID=A0A1I7XBK3_HETBA